MGVVYKKHTTCDRLALWRTKKSHFRPSDGISRENVYKDEVNTKIGLILLSRCIKILKIDANVHFNSLHASI